MRESADPAPPLTPVGGGGGLGGRAGGPELTASPLLTCEGLAKAFAGVRAVRDIGFEVPAGAVLGVMGPNGSGKTTLFNLISGAIRPDGGRIRVHGADITGLPPHRVCAHGIARTFQHVRPFPG